MTDKRRNRAQRAHEAARARRAERNADPYPDWSLLYEARRGMPTSNADRNWTQDGEAGHPIVSWPVLEAGSRPEPAPRARRESPPSRASERGKAHGAARTWHWPALLIVGLVSTWALSSVALGSEPPSAGAAAPVAAGCPGAQQHELRALYVRGDAQADRSGQVVPAFRRVTAQIDALFERAGLHAGTRPVQFAQDALCVTTIQSVVVPQAAMSDAASIATALRRLGFNESRARYLYWYDADGCGIALGNERARSTDPGPGFAGLGRECWNLNASTRELVRALGR